ncbi:MAG: radical SAM family heme chaperone HemW [Bacilli bacterium]|nr:radical SAM family heme chaperone HemW [Bacilli bacterium]
MHSVYIHIPFCNNICSYCDFSKVYYNEELVDKYLEALKKEVNKDYKGEVIKTIYIGGGTPSSLSIKQLNTLFSIIKIFKLANKIEFTIECNPESMTKEKLSLFKHNKVNRLSIGVQTFNKSHLKLLNRVHTKKQVKELIKDAKEIGIANINIDLIYGLSNQTIKEVEDDIDAILKLDVTHISTYSLIIEENTKLYINNVKNINEETEYEMYELIRKKLLENGFIHYEISNFSKEGYQSKHNLNYWNNNNYYGFGLGAHGYINNIRYENTRSLTKYIDNKYLYECHKLTKQEMMENEMILGLRKIKGVNKKEFKTKYKRNIKQVFNIDALIDSNDLIEDNENIYIPINRIYISNNILINFI